jgi:tellurite resistance protein TerC
MQSIGTPFLWVAFTVVVTVVLAVDLYLGSKNTEAMSRRAALGWTALWVSLAVAFGAGIWLLLDHERSREAALEFFTAYIIEYSLSVDNLFVFLLLFSSFKVPAAYQHRVLFWGIFGAVLLRAIFIFAGTALLQRFHFLIYLFGAFLLWTGVKLVFGGEDEGEVEVSENRIVRFTRRFVPVSDHYDGHHFFTVIDGARKATPLLLVLVAVELSDVVFALDSIPAVFGVSLDPFIVYTSNIFAILGLRSLFFLLSGALFGLRFLKPSLGIVLAFVGAKMCLPLVHWAADKAGQRGAVDWLPEHVPTPVSLAVVGGFLVGGVVLSMLFPGKKPAEQAAAEEVRDDLREAVTGEGHTPHYPPARPPDGSGPG